MDELQRFARALVDTVASDHAVDRWRGDLTPEHVLWDGADSIELPDSPLRLTLEEMDVDPDDLYGEEAVLTLGHLSPEQLGNGEPSLRSDVFQVGALIYLAATGENPFADRHGDEIVSNVLSYEPKPPGHSRRELPLDWDAVCACSLHKIPEQRFASVLDIQPFLDTLARTGGRVRKNPFQPHWPRVIGCAAVVIALAVLLARCFS